MRGARVLLVLLAPQLVVGAWLIRRLPGLRAWAAGLVLVGTAIAVFGR